jgi:THO complex subunit 3
MPFSGMSFYLLKCPNFQATASGDKSVRIWDARTAKSVATIPTKGENINISW